MSNNLRPDLTPLDVAVETLAVQCNRCKQTFKYETNHSCPIDLSIHQLAEIRGAILSVLDEGRLVKGKREPWRFYPGGSGWQPIETAPKDGTPILVYCKSARPTDTYAVVTCTQGLWWRTDTATVEGEPTRWRPLPSIEPDWHMNESGDVNEQRTEFCAEVQALLTKKITQG